MYDVVFDEPFSKGLALNCSEGQGFQLHAYDMINISFKKKNKGYGIKDSYELSPIQASWKDRTKLKAYGGHSISKRALGPDFGKSVDHRRSPVKGRDNYYQQANIKSDISLWKNTHHQIDHSSKSLFQNLSNSKNKTVSKANENLNLSWDKMKESAIQGLQSNNSDQKPNLPSLPNLPSTQNQPLFSKPPVKEVNPIGSKKSTQNKSSKALVQELNQMCATIFKKNARAQFKVSNIGPMQNTMAAVILPDKSRYDLTLSSSCSKEEAIKKCAIAAIKKLKDDYPECDLSSNLASISVPTSNTGAVPKTGLNLALPEPPKMWMSQPVQNNQITAFKQKLIPGSLVEENKKLLSQVVKERKIKTPPSSSQYLSVHPTSNTHARYLYHQLPFDQSRSFSHPNQQYDLNFPPMVSQSSVNKNVFTQQPQLIPYDVAHLPSYSESQSQYQQARFSNQHKTHQYQQKSKPNQNQDVLENRFVPLQVARVNQANRLKNQIYTQSKRHVPVSNTATSVTTINSSLELKKSDNLITNYTNKFKSSVEELKLTTDEPKKQTKQKKSRMAINFDKRDRF